MAKKNPERTPDGIIKSGLRRISMTCRERVSALKRDKYTCVVCGKKKSVAKGREVKVNVHHINKPNWKKIFKIIREELFQTKDAYKTLCVECHKELHDKEREC